MTKTLFFTRAITQCAPRYSTTAEKVSSRLSPPHHTGKPTDSPRSDYGGGGRSHGTKTEPNRSSVTAVVVVVVEKAKTARERTETICTSYCIKYRVNVNGGAEFVKLEKRLRTTAELATALSRGRRHLSDETARGGHDAASPGPVRRTRDTRSGGKDETTHSDEIPRDRVRRHRFSVDRPTRRLRPRAKRSTVAF